MLSMFCASHVFINGALPAAKLDVVSFSYHSFKMDEMLQIGLADTINILFYLIQNQMFSLKTSIAWLAIVKTLTIYHVCSKTDPARVPSIMLYQCGLSAISTIMQLL